MFLILLTFFGKLHNFLSLINKNNSTKRNRQEDRNHIDVALNKSRLGADMNHARDGGYRWVLGSVQKAKEECSAPPSPPLIPTVEGSRSRFGPRPEVELGYGSTSFILC